MKRFSYEAPQPPEHGKVEDAASSEAGYQQFASEQPGLLQKALITAEQMRQIGADPGEAYLRGIQAMYAELTEASRQQDFIQTMESMWGDPITDAQPGLVDYAPAEDVSVESKKSGWLRLHIAALATHLALRKSSL